VRDAEECFVLSCLVLYCLVLCLASMKYLAISQLGGELEDLPRTPTHVEMVALKLETSGLGRSASASA
jgi:hypothetical protein